MFPETVEEQRARLANILKTRVGGGVRFASTAERERSSVANDDSEENSILAFVEKNIEMAIGLAGTIIQ